MRKLRKRAQERLEDTIGKRGTALAIQMFMLGGFVTVLFVGTAAAQANGAGGGGSGICAVPGANSLLPLGVRIIQGVIVIGGIYMLAQGVTSTFGAGRGGGGRSNLLYGVLIIMFGLIFTQFIGFIAGQLGGQATTQGLTCIPGLSGGGGG